MPLSTGSLQFAAWASLLDDGAARRPPGADPFDGLLDFAFRLAELVEGQIVTLRKQGLVGRRRRRAASGALRRLARGAHRRAP